MQRIDGLYIMETERKGRGVFCAVDIPIGSIIEISPVIILDSTDTKKIHQTKLHDYYFLWGDTHSAIALGFGSLYNHNENPNADYQMDFEGKNIIFSAMTAIKAGQEICINYNNGDLKQTELWFEDLS